MREEWGPWIEHDGKGCPVSIGVTIEVDGHDGEWGRIVRRVGTIAAADLVHSCWCRNHPFHGPNIILYRIRKPRGMTILERIAADPEPIAPEVHENAVFRPAGACLAVSMGPTCGNNNRASVALFSGVRGWTR